MAIGGDKRACRTHNETVTLAVKQQADRKEIEQIRREKEQNRWKPKDPAPVSDLLHPRCMGCNKKGLLSPQFHEAMLRLQAEFELIYGRAFDVLSAEDAVIAYEPLKNLACIWMVPYSPKIHFINFHARQAAKLVEFTGLCGECLKKNEIEIPMPKLSLEMLYHLGGVVEKHVETIKQEIRQKHIESN